VFRQLEGNVIGRMKLYRSPRFSGAFVSLLNLILLSKEAGICVSVANYCLGGAVQNFFDGSPQLFNRGSVQCSSETARE
jgi:hypothetical protein